MNKGIEYEQAMDILETLDLSEQTFIEVDSLRNFRKYLSEIIAKKKLHNQYTTRLEGDKLKVVRIR